MPSWPTQLPRPTFTGYAISPMDQALRTDMEVGAPRVRRRSFARNDKIDVRWVFTDAQMQVFRAWFDGAEYAAGGAAWFSTELATGDGGIRNIEARFTGTYKPSPRSGLLWDVTAQLETRGGELSTDQIRAVVMGLVSGTDYPSLVLDFIGNTVLDPRITFTRSSSATRINSAGLIELVAANTARFNYDHLTKSCRGLLIEDPRTNLIANSDMEGTVGGAVTGMAGGAAGSVQIPVVSTAKFIGPNGKSALHTRDTANADSNMGVMYFQALPSRSYTVSIWCYVPASSVITGVSLGAEGANVSGSSAVNTSLRDQWQRVVFSVTTSASFVAGNVPIVLRGNTHLGVIYTDAWQAEEGDYATSYIPTLSSTAGRSAETALIAGTSFNGFYNQLASSLLVWRNSPRYTAFSTYDQVYFNNAIDPSNFIAIRAVGGPTQLSYSTIYASGVNQVDIARAWPENTRIKHAVAFSSNDFSESVNGSQIVSDTAVVLPQMTELRFGLLGAGHFERLAYYPKRLSNSELVRLSGA